jgi:hypothetical protein
MSVKRLPEFTQYVDRIWRLIESAVRESVMEDLVKEGAPSA